VNEIAASASSTKQCNILFATFCTLSFSYSIFLITAWGGGEEEDEEEELSTTKTDLLALPISQSCQTNKLLP
jgi:hypothetical protein